MRCENFWTRYETAQFRAQAGETQMMSARQGLACFAAGCAAIAIIVVVSQQDYRDGAELLRDECGGRYGITRAVDQCMAERFQAAIAENNDRNCQANTLCRAMAENKRNAIVPREKSTAEVLAEADRLLRIRCIEAYGAGNLKWCLDRIDARVQQIYEEQKRAARR